MMAPTHLAAGAAAGLVAAHVSGGNPVLCMALGALAGLLPDIDHPQGSIRRRLPGSNLLFWLSHRGITHTLAAMGIIAVLIIPLTPYAPIFLAGYASHLLADMLTVRGIPLLWPVSNRNVSLLPIRAGGMVETLVIMPGLFVMIALMLLGELR